MVEARVAPTKRDAYFANLASRRAQARTIGAHVWAFEQIDEPGVFVEFTEAASATDVAAVHGGQLPSPLWREVQGD